MTGYVRKDTTNNIADGNVINAADLDAEFDGVQDAFNASTGHKHDGTAGEGATINALGPTQDVTISSTLLAPKTTNTVDIGSSALKFKDLFLAGNSSIGGTLAVTGVATLGAGAILNTPASVTLTNATGLPISTGVSGLGTGVATALAVNVGSAGAPVVNGGALGTPSSGTVTNLTGTASININGTVGATTPTTGAFTTVAASGAVTLSGGTANGVTYLNGSKVLTSGSALTFDGTNLGVGIATGSAKLHLYGSGQIGIVESSGNYTTTGSGYIRWKDVSGNAAFVGYGGNANNFDIYNALNGAVTFSTNATEGMRLTSTGLGIGTSSPSVKLSVASGATGVQGLFSHTSGTPTIAIGNSTTTYNTQIGYNVTSEYGYIQATAAAGVYDDIAINPLGGNVGIGTSSPAALLHISAASAPRTLVQNSSASGSANGSYYDIKSDAAAGSVFYRAMRALDGSNNLRWAIGQYGAPEDTIAFYTGTSGTERMRLDSSGNLGLGVTPSASTVKAFQVPTSTVFGSQGEGLNLTTNAYFDSSWKRHVTGTATWYQQASGAHAWYNAASGTAGTAITFTQALTLDASGFLFLGCTTTPSASVKGIRLTPDFTTNTPKFSTGSATGLVYMVEWINGNGIVGSISTNGSATAYNTSSDYRLKNITGPITNSGNYIDNLNPVEGTWKADGSTFVGLIAHEVQEASRTQVATGTKDGEEMQAMDYSNSELIANLIAEVKSLRQRVATLEAQ